MSPIDSLFTCHECSYLGTAMGEYGKRMHQWHILCKACEKEFNYSSQQDSSTPPGKEQVFVDEILFDNPDEKSIHPWVASEKERCQKTFKDAIDLDLRDSANQFVKWAQLYSL
jgi:transcription elongation factor Elf1